MSFDAHAEDYQRLKLSLAKTLNSATPTEVQQAYDNFDKQFMQSRDTIPQTDTDRAYNLVARAATLIDRQLPFSEEQRAREIIDRAHGLLSEAVSLDPHNADAHRMIAASEQPGFAAFCQWLDAGEAQVREQCYKQRIHAGDNLPKHLRELAEHLAMRPYFRWLATMASQAVICGRNREALRLCTKALDADPLDMGDVRCTAAIAFAKLEDARGFAALEQSFIATPRNAGGPNAWLSLGRMALAYKQCDFESAESELQHVITTYPHAAATFIRQHELPDGVFARLPVAPGSEDELIVALSEATVLLQEGREQGARGPFGLWLAETATEMAPSCEAAEIAQARQQAEERFRILSDLAHNRGDSNKNNSGEGNDGSPAPEGDLL